MKMLPYFFGFLIISSHSSFASVADCAKFAGNYTWGGINSNIGPGDTYFIEKVAMSIFPNTNEIKIESLLGKNTWIETLTVDGNRHPGDGKHTGESYVASCAADQIQLSYSFKDQIAPVVTRFKFYLNGTTKYLVIYKFFEGYEQYTSHATFYIN